MKKYINPSKEQWAEIATRPVSTASSVEQTVRDILSAVRLQGEAAIRQYALEFDGLENIELRVSSDEIRQAQLHVPDALKRAILLAKDHIEKFHSSQVEAPKLVEIIPGLTCWRNAVPIEKPGFYIPGGTAPLFSTVLMLAVPASIAGCRDIILCTPPGIEGNIHPAILYTASLCGIDKIFRVGGAQAIASMAYGTSTIPRVQKIFGPGNSYVTMAKQLIQLEGIAIDMPAGPSEIMVIADETANPAFVAADLLSQAEHGPDSQVILLTTSEGLVEKVSVEIEFQLETLPRKEMIRESLRHGRLVILHSIEEAVALANLYAPEHLIIACRGPSQVSGMISNAGSVFIGNYSPETAGDYASGTNHVLPTNGYAAMYSGVSVDSFVKKITCQEITPDALASIGPAIIEMANAEGLQAHARSVSIRLEEYKNIKD